MTRINTNVSSLSAQKSLARSNMNLQQALTRLSTGLRINTGKDDPAGLIASEVLRSDIISVERAIINGERANQMIATADSSLGQINGLLNDIRGLVSDAANTGALSAEQIAANQLQIDSSLEAIDRIAQVTTFQGKRLLDGNLDFVTAGVSSNIQALQIDQANFGTQSEIGVTVDVVAQAEKAQLQYASNTTTANVVLEVGGSKGFEAFSFAAGSTIDEMAAAINLVSDALGVEAAVTYNTAVTDSTGAAVLTTVGSSDNITVTADTAGATPGDIAIQYTLGLGATAATWTAATTTSPAEINVALESTAWAAASGSDVVIGAATGDISLTPQISGEQFNNVTLALTLGGAGTASYDYETNTLSVDAAAGLVSTITTLINNEVGNLFVAAAGAGADDAAAAGTYLNLSDGTGTDGGTIIADVGDVIGAINTGTVAANVTATGNAASTDLATLYTHYAMYGNENTGGTTEPNNRMQFLAPAGASEMGIAFVKGGASETLSVAFTANPVTDGYSPATVQGALAPASIQIVAKNRGTEYDGTTVVFAQHATREDVLYNPVTSTLTVYNDFDGGAIDADDVIAQINTALDGDGTPATGLFTASAFGGIGTGIVAKGAAMATFDGGDQYTQASINLATDASGNVTTTAAELATFVNASLAMQGQGISVSHVGASDGSGLVTAGTTTFQASGVTSSNGFAQGATYNRGGTNAQMTISATTSGTTFDDVQVIFRDDPAIPATATERVVYDSEAKELNIYIDSGTSTLQDVLDEFTASNNPTEFFQFTLVADGDATGVLYSTDSGQLTGGVTTSGTSNGVDMSGNYNEGDVIGTTGLTFQSVNYGENEFVSVKALAGSFQVTDAAGQIRDRDAGADVNVRLNGIQAISEGLDVSMNTSVLDLSFTLAATVVAGTEMTFQITSGGAQFQLGPDVVSNQQARLGIQSVNTAKVGGTAGRLYELRSGGAKAVDTDVSGAAAVVDQVITQVTTLRGRLGAFQKTTLETNIAALSDTLENLVSAESSIRDADFAKESAALTRAQILVQSGVSVLSIANSNPQNVLALLR